MKKTKKAVIFILGVLFLNAIVFIPLVVKGACLVLAQEIKYKDMPIQELQEEYERLLKHYGYLLQDRDNLVFQTRRIAVENRTNEGEIVKLEAALKKAEKEKESLQNLLLQEKSRSIFGIMKERFMAWIKKFKKN